MPNAKEKLETAVMILDYLRQEPGFLDDWACLQLYDSALSALKAIDPDEPFQDPPLPGERSSLEQA